LLTVLLFGLAGWVFWPALNELAERWSVDPQYSHCVIVPLVSLYVLWARRHHLPAVRSPSLLGVLLVAAGLGLNYLGESTFYSFLQAFAFVLVLAGLVAAMHGWRTLAWSLPGLALLCFAIPLPYRVHSALAAPMQRLVAQGSAAVLQVMEQPAVAMGHIVAVGDQRVSVIDACAGLGMLFVFVFLAAVIAALSRRPMIDKLLVFVMAPLVGVLANIFRVSATLEARALGLDPVVATRVHDIGGYLMAPIGFILLLFFLMVVGWVFPTSKTADEPLQIAFQLGVADQAESIAPAARRSTRQPR
jgi:exosortase